MDNSNNNQNTNNNKSNRKKKARKNWSKVTSDSTRHKSNTSTSKSSNTDTETLQDASEQTVNITQKLLKGKYECLVCFDKIGKHAVIWSCGKCFSIFHIGCVNKWSNASKISSGWACPVCRVEISGKPKSHCFCGKVYKPRYNPYLTPHSCGDICNKKREGTSCPHRCTQICHPGACSSCPAMGLKIQCFCEKSSFQLRCGEPEARKSCGNICDQLLACNKHRCEEICHADDCNTCKLTFERICYCGKQKSQLQCGNGKLCTENGGYFACNGICGKKLSCGNHYCKLPCHFGACKQCDTSADILTCPCGTFTLEQIMKVKKRDSCLDPICVCDSICGKPLLQCNHTCKKTCHIAQCGPCKENILVLCRCGKTNQTIICSELYDPVTNLKKDILCDEICKMKKTCNKHKCNTKCCPLNQVRPNMHHCTVKCNRLLSCKLHKCDNECHSGKCKPCLQASFDELSCKCGKTTIFPPISCGTLPPQCPYPCSRIHECEHPVSHSCHYEAECPKCYALVTKLCGCGKKYMTTKCCIEFPSCGDLCKKPLKCGIHLCNIPCHPGECQDASMEIGSSCGLRCNGIKENCIHPCSAICHPGEKCPDIQCTEKVELRCPCGNNKIPGICLRGDPTSEYHNDDYIRLNCTDICALQLREQQISSIFNSNETPGHGEIPLYSIHLTNAAVSVPKFVDKIEKIFQDLIQRDRSYQFPKMNNFYCSVVVQLGEYYKLKHTFNDGAITIVKTADSKIPSITLRELVARHPIPKQPGTGFGINQDGKPSGILFYDLDGEKYSLIHKALTYYSGQYDLKRVDDNSAVAMFNDEKTMKVAAYNISNIPWLSSSPLFDTDCDKIFSKK